MTLQCPLAVDLKESFYVTFWSLQATFSNPSLLSTSSSKPSKSNSSTPASTPAPGAKDTNEPSSYKLFLARLDAVLKTFQKRTDRERVLRGAGDGSLKRPREGEEEGEGLGEGYMPKFLTNPQLLDYEVRPSPYPLSFPRSDHESDLPPALTPCRSCPT